MKTMNNNAACRCLASTVRVVFSREKGSGGKNAGYDGDVVRKEEEREGKPDSKCWVNVPAFARHDHDGVVGGWNLEALER